MHEFRDAWNKSTSEWNIEENKIGNPVGDYDEADNHDLEEK